jgi:hypothetical protein
MSVNSIYAGELAFANTLRLRVCTSAANTAVKPSDRRWRSAVVFLTKYRRKQPNRA